MSQEELIAFIRDKNPEARRWLFEYYYGKLFSIAARYCKDAEQTEHAFHDAFTRCFNALKQRKNPPENLDIFMVSEFTKACIEFIKGIRSEYFVSSTVYAVESGMYMPGTQPAKAQPDYNKADTAALLGALRKLSPAQRLIFNLHVIDQRSLPEAASLLESSEATVKSNLEKARFNLQKNLETQLQKSKS